MARKRFSCDFETTTKLNDCRVWAWGTMEIGKSDTFQMGNSIDTFMQWVEKVQGNLYFHNLRFDGEFIVNWLLKNGFKWEHSGLPKTFHTVISKMGQWYMIDICYGYKKRKKCHTIIYDSLKKLPFTVEKIAKDFKLDIRKIDEDKSFYEMEREIGHEITDDEMLYLKHDVEIISKALDIQLREGDTHITNGSDSLNEYKNIITKTMFERLFPVLSLELDADIRKAYRGGFTWVNEKYQEKELKNGIVFDVNSLYPSQMYQRELPYDVPISFKGEYQTDEKYPLYIQNMTCEFELKKNHIPMIQLKHNLMFGEHEYLKSSNDETVELYVTNVDLKLIKEHYNLYNVKYQYGWKFKSKTGLFKEFIDKWMYVKTHESGAKKILAKLKLNALYGKFATDPNVTGKIPYLKEDGSCGFRKGEEEYRDPIYTPMGIFITSWARYTTITAAQKCYDRIIYCDTDSMHLVGTSIPENIKDIVDAKKLGYWKHESTWQRGKFLRQKTYVEEIDGRLNVKCAGMPDRIKEKVTFENFKKGFKSFGKLMPKHVDGGIVLVDSEFTIK